MSSEQSDVIFARISYTSDTAVSTLQVLYSNYRNSADLPEVEDCISFVRVRQPSTPTYTQ